MRILLDESVPSRLAPLLVGHETMSVQQRGWTSIKNGKLLALAAGEFDVLLTADKGMEYQQNLAALPVSILVVRARSNRMEHLGLAVPGILCLDGLDSVDGVASLRSAGQENRLHIYNRPCCTPGGVRTLPG